MLFHKSLSLIVGVFLQFTDAEEECKKISETDDHKLLRNILCNYDKSIRPVKKWDRPLKIDISFSLLNFNLEESSNSFGVQLDVIMKYKDEFLNWDPNDFNGILALEITGNAIWIPKLSTINSRSTYSGPNFEQTSSIVDNVGNVVVHAMKRSLSHCIFDLSRWPYDTHECTIQFFSDLYPDMITFKPTFNISSLLYKQNIFDLESGRVKVESEDDRSDITLEFKIRRHSSFLTSVVTVPTVVAILLILLSFWTNPMENFRIVLLFTSFFIHILLLQYFLRVFVRDMGTTINIVSYVRNSVVVCCVSMVLLCLIKVISLTNEPPVKLLSFYTWVKSSKMSIFLLLPEDLGAVKINDCTETKIDETKQKWMLAFTLFDRLSFYSFFIFYFVLIGIDFI